MLMAVLSIALIQAIPIGPEDIEVRNTSYWNSDISPKILQAQAGNVTELYISGNAQTQTWQGYFGEIDGTIFLDDSENYTMYDWILMEPQGEIYATSEAVSNWETIHCLDYSANNNFCYNSSNQDGSFFTNDSAECNESANPDVNFTYLYYYSTNENSTTDIFLNLSILESGNLSWSLGLLAGDYDGVDETFNESGYVTANYSGGSNRWVQHSSFMTGNVYFDSGTCPATDMYEAVCTNMTDSIRRNQYPVFFIMNDTQTPDMLAYQNQTLCEVYATNPNAFNDTYLFNVSINGIQYYDINLSSQIFKYQGSEYGANFQEVLLTVNNSQAIIYTTIIEDDLPGSDGDLMGYNNRTHDFQMIVGDDGHVGPNRDTTTQYYFYIELG
jgi:hypothetical protein